MSWTVYSDTVTGSFPTGCMTDPLTALGVMVEGSRLSGCSERIRNSDVPATDTSVPESDRTSVGGLAIQGRKV